jgi:hypothetical protein
MPTSRPIPIPAQDLRNTEMMLQIFTLTFLGDDAFKKVPWRRYYDEKVKPGENNSFRERWRTDPQLNDLIINRGATTNLGVLRHEAAVAKCKLLAEQVCAKHGVESVFAARNLNLRQAPELILFEEIPYNRRALVSVDHHPERLASYQQLPRHDFTALDFSAKMGRALIINDEPLRPAIRAPYVTSALPRYDGGASLVANQDRLAEMILHRFQEGFGYANRSEAMFHYGFPEWDASAHSTVQRNENWRRQVPFRSRREEPLYGRLPLH